MESHTFLQNIRHHLLTVVTLIYVSVWIWAPPAIPWSRYFVSDLNDDPFKISLSKRFWTYKPKVWSHKSKVRFNEQNSVEDIGNGIYDIQLHIAGVSATQVLSDNETLTILHQQPSISWLTVVIVCLVTYAQGLLNSTFAQHFYRPTVGKKYK